LALITTIALAVLATVGAVISRQLSDEFKAWSPWIVRKVIQRAVRQLPENKRQRFAEEWQAHVNEIPGDVGKIVVAFGFLSAAGKISSDLADRSFFVFSKRVFDIAVSLSGIAFLAPVFVAAAIAIKLDSPGPVFVRQTRYGYNSKTVKILKLRTTTTMEGGTKLREFKIIENLITPVGHFLRRTNVDEIPQLFNVLMGEMSIVGPRPLWADPSEVFQEQLSPFAGRIDAKPGITGWAQINALRMEGGSIEQKIQSWLERDLFYIDNRSFLLDLKILLITVVRKRPSDAEG
jgi:lipopolysaccharide/colanic/teichoic acid biosynthesis glycosyltransferase